MQRRHKNRGLFVIFPALHKKSSLCEDYDFISTIQPASSITLILGTTVLVMRYETIEENVSSF
jgi:hypothetical protein